jgi:hypothetical protein
MLKVEWMGASMHKIWKHRVGVLLAITIGLTGCTPTTDTNTPPPTPKSTPTSSSSTSPTPARSTAPKPLSCQNIVTPDALSGLTTSPWAYVEDFPDRMRQSEFAAFMDDGGVLCMWGYPNSDIVVILAYSPISDAQAAQQRKRLSDSGWESKTQPDGSERWTHVDESLNSLGTETYVFRAGNWRYASDIGYLSYLAL